MEAIPFLPDIGMEQQFPDQKKYMIVETILQMMLMVMVNMTPQMEILLMI